MKRLVEFQLQDGSTIVVETEESEEMARVTRTARQQVDVIEEAKHTFEAALEKIRVATEGAIAKLRNLGEKPDEVTMEFGFNLNAQLGAIIASTSAEANYKVTLTWSSKPSGEASSA